MNKKMKFATTLIKKAKEEILIRKEKFTFKQKSNHSDLVTDVDIYIEEFISKAILRNYPDDSVLGEEKNKYFKKKASNQWILDPIDGTLNFVSQGKNYAISLAYYEDEKPVFGIVADVVSGDFFSAIVNQGAYYNSEKIKPIKEKVLDESMVITSHRWIMSNDLAPHLEKLNQCRHFRYYGVASLEICYVAIGLADMYISCSLFPWDYAAAIIIAKEVGLIAKNINGKELNVFEKSSVIVSSENLYKEIFGQ
ncbi:MAG: inositol monophosphatase family protein [Clostridia bacterium]